jgi:hypothetical protein
VFAEQNNPKKQVRMDALILFLQTIMIARVLKNESREKMRDVTSQSTMQSILVTRMNQITSLQYDAQFFDHFVVDLVKEKFDASLLRDTHANNLSANANVNLSSSDSVVTSGVANSGVGGGGCIRVHKGYLISNFCHSLGIILSFNARSKISQAFSETMSVRFQSSDIEDVAPIVKYSSWIDLGMHFYFGFFWFIPFSFLSLS